MGTRTETARASTGDERTTVPDFPVTVNGCGQPAFRFATSADASTLTDVVVEVQQWQASV